MYTFLKPYDHDVYFCENKIGYKCKLLIFYICNMNESISYLSLYEKYEIFKNQHFKGRYLPFMHLEAFLRSQESSHLDFKTIGYSEQQKPIYTINVGSGKKKILIWSQMHGNESTTTKAILDLLNYLYSNQEGLESRRIVDECEISIIPMLNPDGASMYSRFNANEKDLNRDAIDKTQKETQCFFKYLEHFQPDYCFNMHGQRSIFGAGETNKPASMSFLAPSFDHGLSINANRLKAMQLIFAAAEELENIIPGQIGRYDDAHNPNCFGDYIQKMGIPTILFEAGHFQMDYCRNETRKFVFLSVLKMLQIISNSAENHYKTEGYFNIPMNRKSFVDLKIVNIKNREVNQIGIQYNEVLKQDKLIFQPYIFALKEASELSAHLIIDAKQQQVFINGSSVFENAMVIKELIIGHNPIEIGQHSCK